ncbi:MAG TPA: polyamine aminopropyltransferase [Leptospiraceae bacterium]|nr:polyamine aminopropyltransferase [Leptospiraceae bacterium]HMW07388.1 polyamine aminopropyltransferase [Leptospiraceae bacterium]HMX34235.1 polyamine aminopropyltransferase [Leptospiraceae bacterium]HMY32452.1 polyamine aminopropyltransferase [Leptospiraceae bacterium]HMZ64207.1 polyamine aminopropyltransferase [Leptospiraceae bacterium]
MSYVLLFSVFIIATCGLVYELIAGSLASYLLGDSITQFSTIIGAYLFSMGIGSFLSKYIRKNLIGIFVQVELLIGIVGGSSAALLFLAFEHVASFRILLYTDVSITGMLVGLEIPLMMRILKTHFEFSDLVSKIFTFDYIGALFASILFPLLLVPHLGLVRTAFLFGIFNVLTGIWTLYVFEKEIPFLKTLKLAMFTGLILLFIGFVYSNQIMSFAETASYPDKVIYSKYSKYQRIVLTRSKQDLRLFLNGNLQFSSKDEYRYHEALVHIGLASLDKPKKVLVLGGGDGLAVREILKYDSVEEIVLVDLDPEITGLFSKQKALTALNENSLLSPKVKIYNEDAFIWLKTNETKFDFIAVDFPDPSNYSVGKLYTNSFYKILKNALATNGVGVIQSTSPYVAKKSFWCVNNTLVSVGLNTLPYHVYVPAFGDWGYILFSKDKISIPEKYPTGLKYITPSIAKTLTIFSDDMIVESNEVNRLNNQILVRLFEEEWEEYAH